MSVYKTISFLCDGLGIERFGVTTAQPFESIAERLASFCLPGFCETDINKRIYPSITMPGAKSIVCILFPYMARAESTVNAEPGRLLGKIVSGDVWLGEDYHVYTKRKLERLCSGLRERLGGQYMAFCDTGPLVDKEIAVRSGLCEYGRNSLAINKEYGSFFYIGYILTDLEIENAITRDTNILSDYCSGCDKCAKACPTGAISDNNTFSPIRCISYISQKKGALEAREAHALGDTLYGCHICQNICPANKALQFVSYVDIEENANISNKEFSQKFGNTAMSFIGKKTFLRNARAVLNNSRSVK